MFMSKSVQAILSWIFWIFSRLHNLLIDSKIEKKLFMPELIVSYSVLKAMCEYI